MGSESKALCDVPENGRNPELSPMLSRMFASFSNGTVRSVLVYILNPTTLASVFPPNSEALHPKSGHRPKIIRKTQPIKQAKA